MIAAIVIVALVILLCGLFNSIKPAVIALFLAFLLSGINLINAGHVLPGVGCLIIALAFGLALVSK